MPNPQSMQTAADVRGEDPRPHWIRTWWFGVPLWKRILLGMILGAAVGFLWGDGAMQIKWIGDLFIRLIRMLVVPLVLVTIVSGMVAMADIRKLGSIGLKIAALYAVGTFAGAALGLLIGSVLKPGEGISLKVSSSDAVASSSPQSLTEQFLAVIPINPVAALAQGDMLAIIFFSLMFGAALLASGEKGAPLARAFEAATDAMLHLTRYVMEVAPFGVFALIAWVMGTVGPSAFINIFMLTICVLIGCAAQVLFIHGGFVRVLARLPVRHFFRAIAEPIVVAFSTSSSAATLPVTLRVAEEKLGVSKAVTSTALPVGVTVSMDGTAMYVALLTMFAAQAFGVELHFSQYITIILVTTLIAVGSAPIPSGALFLLASVLQVIGLDSAHTAVLVGFILPFDRLLDMMRTVPNCTGDLSVAVTVARWEKQLNESIYRRESDR